MKPAVDCIASEIDNFIRNKNAQEVATAPGPTGTGPVTPRGCHWWPPGAEPVAHWWRTGARWFHVKKQFRVALAGVGLPGYVT